MNTAELWIVMDKNGFGYSPKDGMKLKTPNLFSDRQRADDFTLDMQQKFGIVVVGYPIQAEDLRKLAGVL